jgi:hypothetical protein
MAERFGVKPERFALGELRHYRVLTDHSCRECSRL